MTPNGDSVMTARSLGTALGCAILLASCGTGQDGDGQSAEAAASASSIANGSAEEGQSQAAGLEERRVGPLTIRYDPQRLAAVDASIPVPPDWDRRVSGVKLIGADRERLIGQERCEYGLSGMEMECEPESEAGLALALLDEPYEEARERSGEGAGDIRIGGVQGTRWSIGVEGENTEYILLPAGNRTALIEHRTRMRENPDEAAITQARESLRTDS